jgi:predicted porin
MQKKIIALAVAGLVSGAAFAQTNVTLYGRADLSYTYSKSDFRKFQGVENGLGIGGGANRLGVMGEESLGNGLKAIFKFEWGLDADIGGGPVGARYTYVGLAGNFGTVTLGRNGTPSDLYMGATSPWGINGHEPIARFRANMPIIDGVRWNNSVAYASPNFSGLSFMGIYSFGEKVNTTENRYGYDCTTTATPAPGSMTCGKGADTTDASMLGLGVRYANGPLYVSAVYHMQADDDSVKTWNVDHNRGYGAKGWGIGGTYDFKVAKVYANYFRAQANDGGRAFAPNTGSDKQTAWSLGVSVPVSSAGPVVAEYAQYKDDLNGGLRLGAAERYLDGRNAGHKTKSYSVGYRHNLSKRTSLYSYLSYFNNDRGINVGWAKTGVAGEKQTNFTVGILHVF